MNLADRCRGDFESRDKSRGRTYFLDKMVSIHRPQPTYVTAVVEGSNENYYAVTIDWSEVGDHLLCVECDCPRFTDGYLCKHVWATLLEMDRTGVAKQVPGSGRLDVMEFELETNGFEIDEVGLTKFVPQTKQLSTASKSRGSSANSSQIAPWQQTFPLLNHARQFASLDDVGKNSWTKHLVGRRREAWYVLNVSDCIEQGCLVIQLYQRETKHDGKLGKLKQLSLSQKDIATFSDSTDQRLLEQLFVFREESEEDDSYRYRYYNYTPKAKAVALPTAAYEGLLPSLAATGRFLWQLDSLLPIEEATSLGWDDGESWRFQLELFADDVQKHWTLGGYYQRGEERRPLGDGVMPTPTGLLLMDNKLASLDAPGAVYDWLMLMLRVNTPIQIPYQDRASFLKQLWSAPELPPLKLPDNLQLQEICETPLPCLKVHAPEGGGSRASRMLGAEVTFRYGEREVPAAAAERGIVDSEDQDLRVLLRDRQAETARIAELGKLGAQPASGRNGLEHEVEIVPGQLAKIVDGLIGTGWQVEAEGKLFRTAGDFKIEVTSDIDWFELDATVDFDGVEANLPELLAAVRKGEKYVELGDGSRGMLPEQWLDRYAQLTDLGTTADGKVRFQPSQALMLDAMLAEQSEVQIDRRFSRFREKLRSFEGVKAKCEPKTFSGSLREYQQEGLGWFHFLQDLNLGGCLADDMGLGKTIQVLALLEHRRTRRLKKDETRRGSLVVVPKSLIFNWIDEAAKFTPKLRVADYTGLDRRERVGDLDDYHLILTTYGTLRRDIALLKDYRFDYAILDESQAIKNSNSQAAKACRLLQANHRLALTGTPIENHLGELWSLFEYLNPGMLGHSKAFASLCKSAKSNDTEALGDLARAVAPFILRRTKQQVLTELPDKTEQTLFCDLLPKDRKAYDELRDFYRAKLAKKIDQKGLKQSKIHVLEALLRLRQAACHPGLVDKEKVTQSSAKLDVLLQQIREVTSEGHKALVFSQFTSLLSIVRTRLEKSGIVYEYLDGRTRDRKAKVERFQSDEACPLFLISLKAGGSGLNLTAADYVYILDPWWNPAVEAQAIDRTHRMGQTQHVFAYRIIARDTVEEKVLELQKSKRELADAIITADESLIRNLTADDLQMILS